MDPDRKMESFQRDFPNVVEPKFLPNAQLGYDVRCQDLVGHGMGAESGGQLNGRPEKILVVLHWFPGSDANSKLERPFAVFFAMPG